MIYFFLFLTLSFLSIIYEINSFKKGKNFLIFIIIFILAFNYQMGSDWINYQKFYEDTIPFVNLLDVFKNKMIFEKGYVLLNVIFYNLGFNYELFMGIILSICIYILLNSIYRYADNYYLSFLIFITSYLLSSSLEPVIRQLIAITIITYSFKYIKNRHFISYFIFVIIAMQFHFSAIIGILFYILECIKITLKRIIFIIIGFYTIIINFNFLIKILAQVISKFSYYNSYLENIKYGIAIERSFLGNLYYLFISIFYLYLIFFSYEFSLKKSNFLKNSAILYVIFIYFKNLLPISYRITQYFVLAFSISMGSIKFLRLFKNKTIVFNKKKLGFIYIFFMVFPMYQEIYAYLYASELNKFRYLNYKNYFIEIIKGNLEENFKEKKNKYEKIINNLIEKEYEALKKRK